MGEARTTGHVLSKSVRIANRGGRSPIVLICDHASNEIPTEFGTLGLEVGDLSRHIAWDPGALPVAGRMADSLDAALIECRVSRLVIDCNRPLDAPDLIPAVSETIIIPGNQNLARSACEYRIALSWKPFHDAIEALVEERLSLGMETWLVSIHSFTPVYRQVARPGAIGILHDEDVRLSRPVIEALRRFDGITVGDNQPYSPADRVYYTLERHARSRGLPCAMIEIRNDEIADEIGQRKWADRLSGILADIKPDLAKEPAKMRQTDKLPVRVV